MTGAGCTGAQTTGNGILLVSVKNGTTTANAFTLAAPVTVNGYTYRLVQVGGDWYLQGSPPPPNDDNGNTPGIAATPLDPRTLLLLIGTLLAIGGAAVRRRG